MTKLRLKLPYQRFQLLLGVLLICFVQFPSRAVALTDAQKKVYDSGIYFFDVATPQTCGSSDTGGASGSSTVHASDIEKANAMTVIGIAKTENLGKAAALIGLMVALDESTLHELANSNVPLSNNNPNKQGIGSNGTSLGMFQQQISTNWSTISTDINNADAVNQLMTPAYNAEAFFGSPKGSKAPDALSKGLQNDSGWQSKDPWVAAQDVQASGTGQGADYGGNYKAKLKPAQSLLDQYYDSSPAVPLPVPLNSSGGSTTGADNSVDSSCVAGGVVAGSIVQTALGLAWPKGGHGKQQSDATTAYQKAMPQTHDGDPGNDAWSDCGVFVSTVIISSGADKNYLKRGSSSQEDYMASHPKLYKPLGTITSSAQVQAGDIFVNDGHTFVYVGPQPGGDAVTEASWGDHVPQLDRELYFTNFGQSFRAFRLMAQGS